MPPQTEGKEITEVQKWVNLHQEEYAEIKRLKKLLKSAHYLLQDCDGDIWKSEFKKWLDSYRKIMGE